MRVLKFIIFLIILIAIGIVLTGLYFNRVELTAVDETRYTFNCTADGEILLTFDRACNRAELLIDHEKADAQIMYSEDKTIFTMDLELMNHNELMTFEIIIFDENNEQADKVRISNVCVSTDGDLPEYDIKTLVLYDYEGEAMPEFDTTRLSSLFIINNSTVKKNISFDDIRSITNLKSLWIKSNGGVYGNVKSLKSLGDLRRLVIQKAGTIDGDLDDIDGLTLLEYLEISDSNIKGELKDLVPLKKIKMLILSSNNRIDGDIKWLKKFDKLEQLYLVKCKFTGDLEEFNNMKYLEELNIENCSKISGSLTLNTGEVVSAE